MLCQLFLFSTKSKCLQIIIDIFHPWILSSFEAEYIFNIRIWSFYYYFTEYTNFVLSYLRLNDELLDTHLETQSVGIEALIILMRNIRVLVLTEINQWISVNAINSWKQNTTLSVHLQNTTLSVHLQSPIEKS